MDPYGVMWWPQLGQFVAREKFEFFLSNALGAGPVPHDRWERVMRMVRAFNVSTRVFQVGRHLTLDESMCGFWGQETFKEAYAAGHRRPGAGPPGQFVPGKPVPKGYWSFTLAAFYAGSHAPSLLWMEPRSNPEPDPPGLSANVGYMTRAVLRAVWRYRGSWRTVYAASAYASVELTVELFKLKLYFVGVVKTNTSKFPKKYLQELGEGLRRGEHRLMTSAVDVTAYDGEQLVLKLRAVAWVDRKVFTFVASRGSTEPGALIRRKRWNPTRGFFMKEVTRPRVVEELHDSFGAVDLHNRYRQAGYEFERIFRTANFEKRYLCFVLGALLTNAYAAWAWDLRRCNDDLSRAAFTRTLMQQLFAAGGAIQASTSRLQRLRSPTPSLMSWTTPPLSRRRSGEGAAADTSHKVERLRELDKYASLASGKKAQIRCRVCRTKTSEYCVQCSDVGGD